MAVAPAQRYVAEGHSVVVDPVLLEHTSEIGDWTIQHNEPAYCETGRPYLT
jgi:hypothetical protein